MKRALILQGGGARGDFQAGKIKQLDDLGYTPTYCAVSGSSVGAINGVMVATGQIDRMVHEWSHIRKRKVMNAKGELRFGFNYLFHKIGLAKPFLGYYSADPLRKMIKKNIGSKFLCDFYAGIVDIEEGQAFWEEYVHPKGAFEDVDETIDYILASAAIPVVFDPVIINERMKVDGGVLRMTPIGRILHDHDPDEVIIITTQFRSGEKNRPKDVIDVASATLKALTYDREVDRFLQINNYVKQLEKQGAYLEDEHGKRLKYYKTFLVKPDQDLGGTLEFDAEKSRKNLQLGYAAPLIEL